MRVLLCTISAEEAPRVARALVEERLVACVNVLPGVRSFYRWEGEVHDDPEVLMVLKTTEEGVGRVLERLPELHPYDTPEILALPVTEGFAPYVSWVEAETAPAP